MQKAAYLQQMYSQMFARFQTVNLSTNFLTQIGYFIAIDLCGLGIFVFAETHLGFKVEGVWKSPKLEWCYFYYLASGLPRLLAPLYVIVYSILQWIQGNELL